MKAKKRDLMGVLAAAVSSAVAVGDLERADLMAKHLADAAKARMDEARKKRAAVDGARFDYFRSIGLKATEYGWAS